MCRIGFTLCIVLLLLSCQADRSETAETETPATMQAEQQVAGEEFVAFLYHRFGDPQYRSTNISLVDFRRQLQYLKENNFEVLTLGEALAQPVDPERRRAVITVDDGFNSFLTGAMPLLNEFGFPVTLFINTETVGSADYLGWDQLDSLQERGVEIGNHSHSHAYFLNDRDSAYLDRFREDVTRAQALIEERIGVSPEMFAYPYGEYDAGMQEVIRELGFRAAAAQHSGVILKDQDTWALPRFPMSDAYAEMESFKDKANARAFRLQFQSPASPVITDANPPYWKLITREALIRGRMQCFVQGGFCRMDSSGDTLIVHSENPLDSRRTLYTITMPDGEGRWYWRSHLWIKPD